MTREEQLREIVRHFLQLSAEDLTAATPLNGSLSGSIGRARLDAALRSKLGFSKPEVYSIATYGQLADAICGFDTDTHDSGGDRPRVRETPLVRPARAANHHDVGVDIESIRNLPEATDYWESPFYKSHFTKVEIAYCMLQPKPLETFVGLWSAKEALRKTAQKWANLEWQAIEVAHDPEGSPYLVVGGVDLRPEYSASISHTSEFSIAVVVRMSQAETQRGMPIAGPPQTTPTEKRSPAKWMRPISVLLLLTMLFLIWSIFKYR
jgi:phosphopantetheine--protein transferase-like protein